MNQLSQVDLTRDEAEAFVRHVRASVEEIGAWIVRAVTGRAWVALGYASWDAMCEAEFDGAVIRLPREDRREAVASLREAGLSTRAIAGALDVSPQTVSNDLARLSTSGQSTPDRVTSLDGRSRPATHPRVVNRDTGEITDAGPSPTERSALAVERWPELQFFHDKGEHDRVIRNAGFLDSYTEPELTVRRNALAATIAAEQRAEQEPVEESPDYLALGHELFEAVSRAASTVARLDGVDTVAAAASYADGQTAELWHRTFTDFARRLDQMADAARPRIRRIK